MTEPFDDTGWAMPTLAVELEALCTAAHRADGHAERALEWACEHARAGRSARDLCEAAMWVGLRNSRTEGRGPMGLVSHSVLAAHACSVLGDTGESGLVDPTSTMAAVQLCAYVAGTYRGGINDPAEGPSRLAWFDPTAAEADPVQAFARAAERGETDLTDHAWLAAARSDPVGAEQMLISLGAGGYSLNEHKLVYPAQLRAWVGDDAPVDPVLFRAAARYVGNHLQAPVQAESRRADAAALAEMVDAPTADGDHDLDRVSVVATGIARTPSHDLGPLLMGSLQDGLDPQDLALAVALVNAARFADTEFGADPIAMVGPIHACTGTNALRRCLVRARSDELRFELALCATESPTSGRLAPIAELAVPPFDDGALDDLRAALHDEDPAAAAEAGSAVPPEDADAVDAAVGGRCGSTRRSVDGVHAAKHVVAMREDFHSSTHPARAWFLAAAARTAAQVNAIDQPLARRAEGLLR